MMMMLIMPNSFVDQPFDPLAFVNLFFGYFGMRSKVFLLAVDDDDADADVADFPAVFFHISFLYLSWNTIGK